MATIGNLLINIEARTAKLDKGLREARRGIDRLEGPVRALKGAFLAMIPAITIGALVNLTTRALQSADAMAKAADKVGLGVEALQELQFAAASAAGITDTTLNMAMQRFSRRVGEAAQGTGELKDTLKQYDIAVRNADGSTRSVEAVLADYANAVQNAESQQEKLRLSFKGFDSEGAALVNLLDKGAAGMNKLREEARQLGAVLDEKTIRNAEAMNDALDRMGTIITTKLNKVAIQAVTEFVKAFNVQISDAVVATRLEIEKLESAATKLQGKLDNWIKRGNWIDWLAGKSGDRARLLGMISDINDLEDGLSDFPVVLNETTAAFKSQKEQIIATQRATDEQNNSLSVHNDFLQAQAQFITDVNAALKAMGAAEAEAAKKRQDIQEAYLNGLAEFQKKIDDIMIAEAIAAAAHIQQSLNSFGAIVSSGFAAALMNGERLDKVLSNLIRRLLQAQVEAALFNAITGQNRAGPLDFLSNKFGGGDTAEVNNGGTGSTGNLSRGGDTTVNITSNPDFSGRGADETAALSLVANQITDNAARQAFRMMRESQRRGSR